MLHAMGGKAQRATCGACAPLCAALLALLALLCLSPGAQGAWSFGDGLGAAMPVVERGVSTCCWFNSMCSDAGVDVRVFENGANENGKSVRVTCADCAKHEDLGQLLSVHHPNLCLDSAGKPKCTAWTAVGTRLSTCADLAPGQATLDVYLVPEGRLWIWPTVEPGHTAEVRHLESPVSRPMKLTTLSLSPRVFLVENFFSETEADELVENAKQIKSEDHRLKQSTTGDQKELNKQRTSETAFDSTSRAAVAVTERAFALIGIYPFQHTWADGLQILRYNQSKAYIPHLDWMDQLPPDHDGNSAGKGTNRFATVLLYLTDVEEGGETVFPNAYAPGAEKTPLDVALREADESGATSMFEQNSWERKMVAQCRSRLAVKPKRGQAVLFYSQHPDGRPDQMALHGGCPVLAGTKWAANLWIWNGPRYGFSKRAADGSMVSDSPDPIHATFEVANVDGAELYFEKQPWGILEVGQPMHVNTYAGHEWNVHHRGRIIKTWVIPASPSSQRYTISPNDILKSSAVGLAGDIVMDASSLDEVEML